MPLAADVDDSEVEVLGLIQVPPPNHHDVAGLDVAVDDLSPVREVQRLGDLNRDLEPLVEGCRIPLANQLRNVAAFQVLHDEVLAILELSAIVDRDDVRVLKAGNGFLLDMEAPERRRIPDQVLGDDLDRDEAPEHLASCARYITPRPTADNSQDLTGDLAGGTIARLYPTAAARPPRLSPARL
jgi:hypothetical protein